MGTWTLESVYHITQPHDTGQLFGNHYIVSFRMRYTPSTFGGFKEMPKLAWNEIIMMNEHHKNEHWQFSTNMYTHNPTSKTLLIWPSRYYVAYATAAGRQTTVQGKSQLLDKNNQPVRVDALGANIVDKGKQADAVRSYLKKNGGVMMIEIDDIPSINIPTGNEHKERLLIFSCGVEGGGPKTQAVQYLDVNGATPKNAWTRRFDLSHSMRGLQTTGLRTVPPPALVSAPRPATFTSGECW